MVVVLVGGGELVRVGGVGGSRGHDAAVVTVAIAAVAVSVAVVAVGAAAADGAVYCSCSRSSCSCHCCGCCRYGSQKASLAVCNELLCEA